MENKFWISLLCCLLCLSMLLSGCGSKTDKDGPSAAEPVKIMEGVYVEELAGRGMLFLTAGENGAVDFRIEWSNSAFSRSRWEMTGVYDTEKQAIVYSDCVRIDTEFNEQGQGADTVAYTRGTGSFALSSGKLIWTDDKEPLGSVVFVYSTSLEEYQRNQTAVPDGASPIVIVSPTPAPEGTPAPAPTPAPTATPAPKTPPVVTKDPTDEAPVAGGRCVFIANYRDAIWAVWHFLSPDGKIDVAYDAINTLFPSLKVIDGMYSTMTLENVPYELNGWRVYCRYTNDYGSTDTKTALITVRPAPTPEPTTPPTPTPDPAPTVGPIINAWVDTDSLEEAVTGAGFSFTPPLDQVIPEGLSLKGYRYRTGILEADYADAEGSVKMIIRKSDTVSGVDLAGDNNVYSQSWDHTLKGLIVHCLGDGDTVNLCWFGSAYNYTINYNAGKEGQGLTLDQINSIVNSMS